MGRTPKSKSTKGSFTPGGPPCIHSPPPSVRPCLHPLMTKSVYHISHALLVANTTTTCTTLLFPSLRLFQSDIASPYLTTISRYRRQHEQLQQLQRQRELDERRARLQRLTAANQGHPFFNRLPVSYFNSAAAGKTESGGANGGGTDFFPFFGFGNTTTTMTDCDSFDIFLESLLVSFCRLGLRNQTLNYFTFISRRSVNTTV